jgi:hypothetical protein
MTEHIHGYEEECCCRTIARTVPPVCDVCAPKMYLTPQEEAILEQMRGVKEQARAVGAKLNGLQGQFAGDGDGAAGAYPESEWRELSGKLDELRCQWKGWEQKLDEAIEQKLIALGHREPR